MSFDLSKKIYNRNQGIGDPGYDFLHKEHVKEFIQALRDEFQYMEGKVKWIINNGIDKLAGDKLK